MLERVAQAIDEIAGHWRPQPAGVALLAHARERGQELTRPAPDLADRTNRMVRDWQAALLEMLRKEGAGKRRTAKALSYGVNGVALVLMVGVFSHTGGLTGGEVAIAGGSSAVGQKVLEALLGDQAVRQLAADAREDLARRVHLLLKEEVQRFRATLGDHAPGTDAQRLHELVATMRQAVEA